MDFSKFDKGISYYKDRLKLANDLGYCFVDQAIYELYAAGFSLRFIASKLDYKYNAIKRRLNIMCVKIRPPGGQNNIKLSEKNVIEILTSNKTRRYFSNKFNVCIDTISDIRHRRSWGKVNIKNQKILYKKGDFMSKVPIINNIKQNCHSCKQKRKIYKRVSNYYYQPKFACSAKKQNFIRVTSVKCDDYLPKKILHLILKKEWFDMILSGLKYEEYREIKDYWCRRLIKHHKEIEWDAFDELVNDLQNPYHRWNGPAALLKNFNSSIKNFDLVKFRNGYGKNAPEVIFNIKEICISTGNIKWGAKEDTFYFVVKLGDKIEKPV